jgi:hypothetical protein
VSFISGTLAFYGPGDSDWSAAKVNYPIAAGEWFATDPQSRAEIRIGAQTIDIAGDTQLDIADLGNRVIKAGVTQGRIDVNMRRSARTRASRSISPAAASGCSSAVFTTSKPGLRTSLRGSPYSRAAPALSAAEPI